LKPYKHIGGVEVWLHSFLNSQLERSGHIYATTALIPGKVPANIKLNGTSFKNEEN
jgi:hypothetical protein